MARMLPELCPDSKGGAPLEAAERRLFERLSRELGPGWSVIHDCEVHAYGEAGTIEFVLVHAGFGLALLGIAEPGEEADPELAVTAMRAMLAEIGFGRRFRGEIAIVAKTLRPDAPGELSNIVEGLFAGCKTGTIADPTWPEWLIERLVSKTGQPSAPGLAAPRRERHAPATPAPRLRAPAREEAWRVSEAGGRAGEPAKAEKVVKMRVAPDPRLVSQAARARASIWPAMGFAVVVVALVLTGMAVLSHGNGPSPRANAPALPATK